MVSSSRYRCHQELTSDTSTATDPITNILPYTATAREPLSGHLVPGTGVTSSFVHNLNPAIIGSVPAHHAASPNLPSTAQASHRPMASSSVASIRGLQMRRNHTETYSCPASGCKSIFVQRQGLNRHYRDKHQPELRNVCPFCGVFKWSRKYLFTRHLERDHRITRESRPKWLSRTRSNGR